MGNYAGVDWAADKHDVRVCDETGEELLAATFAHDERGLRALCRALVRLQVELVAIERPDGLLVERLLDAGLRVLAMHPNQVAAARARFRVSGGKSDRFDAFVLCELARTDSHRFRVLEPDSDQTKALRALTRAREDLVHARVALCSQLRAELERFWPGPIGLFTKLDSPISLAFLERCPSPADARGLGEQRLGAFLARQRYSGGQKPAELLSKLRRAPEGRVGEAELAARRALVLALVTAIKPLVEQIKQLTEQIATALREHPDGEIFLSLFRDPRSVVTAAELLAEIGDCRARYPTRDTLAADAGQAAVAVESGKRKTASFRWGCNKRLRGAFCTLADSTRHWHPWAQDRYAAARARGHEHPRALRTVGRAWCRIVWRCWQDGRPYDPAKHRAMQQHCTVTVPTSSGPVPDLAATQRMLGAAVTEQAARRAEREALDRQPILLAALDGVRVEDSAFVVPGGSPLRVGMPPHAAKKPTIVPPGCNAEATAGVLKIYEHTFEKEDQMAAIATEPKPAAKTSEIHLVRIPTARIAGVVDRTAKLSDELLKSFETSERAAIEAIGQFTMTIEEALPHEVTRTSEMAKKVTESGLEMTDRLVHTEYDLLRDVVDSAANWLRGHDGAKSIAA